MNWNEPLIKQKDYLKEEYNAKKLKTFGVPSCPCCGLLARGCAVMS